MDADMAAVGERPAGLCAAPRRKLHPAPCRESGFLTIRGISEMIRVPLMITFYNQLDLARASVACAT